MRITFSPLRSDARPCLERQGDRLIADGAVYDFADLPEGALLPPEATGCPWIAGPVTRQDGVLHLVLTLPHGAGAPPETLFPAPLTVTQDGPLPLPPQDGPLATAQEEQTE